MADEVASLRARLAEVEREQDKQREMVVAWHVRAESHRTANEATKLALTAAQQEGERLRAALREARQNFERVLSYDNAGQDNVAKRCGYAFDAITDALAAAPAAGAGEACEMIRVSGSADVACSGKATYVTEDGVKCCQPCAVGMADEGFVVAPWPAPPSASAGQGAALASRSPATASAASAESGDHKPHWQKTAGEVTQEYEARIREQRPRETWKAFPQNAPSGLDGEPMASELVAALGRCFDSLRFCAPEMAGIHRARAQELVAQLQAIVAPAETTGAEHRDGKIGTEGR